MPKKNDPESLEQIMRNHLFFKGLESEHISFLVDCSSNVEFEAGQYLCRQEESADFFYAIHSGLVALELNSHDQSPIAVQSIQADDVLGWSWLVPPYHWRFNARAIDTTQALALDARCLRSHCDENHELGYQLLVRLVQVMTERLESTRRQLIQNTRIPL